MDSAVLHAALYCSRQMRTYVDGQGAGFRALAFRRSNGGCAPCSHVTELATDAGGLEVREWIVCCAARPLVWGKYFSGPLVGGHSSRYLS